MRIKDRLPDGLRVVLLFAAGVLTLSAIRYAAKVLLAVWK
jgi:hypothetical protein